MPQKHFETVIMAAEKNLPTLRLMIPYCLQNIPHSEIYIVASKKLKADIDKIEGVIFFDENEVLPGLGIDNISNIVEQRTGERKRAGWYFQQFLKMSWAYRCRGESYIVLDADTFPLNPISFIEQSNKDDKSDKTDKIDKADELIDDGHSDEVYLFTQKLEYHKPYFKAIDRLFNGQVKRVNPDVSFVAEHMIFDCKIMQELINKIEANTTLSGNCWWEKILFSVDTPENLLKSGFSEFETYGNYTFTFYPRKAKMRKLRTFRECSSLLGSNPSTAQLNWVANDYDIVSIENPRSRWGGWFIPLTKFSLIRRLFHFKDLVKMWNLVYGTLRTCYRKFIGHVDLRFD